MSDLTPVLQEMAARTDPTQMPMPHEIRRAGERRRMRLAMATATCAVALVAVAAGVLITGITWDPVSVGPAGRPIPNPTATISMQLLAGPGRPGDLPPGTYRYTLTRPELLAQGLASDDAEAEAGIWTWRLGNGRWSYRLQSFAQRPAGCDQETPSRHCGLRYSGTHCAGYYDVVGHQVEFTTLTVYATGQCAPSIWFATWSQAGDRLQMPNHIYGGGYLFDAKPWDRVSGNQ
jgi:hypothetical protein